MAPDTNAVALNEASASIRSDITPPSFAKAFVGFVGSTTLVSTVMVLLSSV